MMQSSSQAAPASVLRKAALWLALILGVCLVLGAALAAVFTLRPDFALGRAQDILAQYGYRLKWETLDLDLARPSLKAAGLTLKGPQLDLALESLDCRALWSDLLGDGPPLETVELKGLALKTGPASGQGGGGGSLDFAAWLLKSRRIRAERVSALVDLGSASLALKDLTLAIESTGSRENLLRLDGELTLSRKGAAGSLKGRVRGTGRVGEGRELSAQLRLEDAYLASAELNGPVDLALGLKLGVDNLELLSIRAGMLKGLLKLPGGDIGLSPTLEASGAVFLADGSMNWVLKKFDLPGLAELSGEASGPTWPLMAGKITCRFLDLHKGMGLLRHLLPAGAAPYSASGRARAVLDLAGDESYALELIPEKASVRGPGLEAAVRGRARLAGGWKKQPELSGRLDLEGSLRAGGVGLQRFALGLPLAGNLDIPSSPGFALAVPAGGFSLGKKALPLGLAGLTGDALWIDDKLVLEKLALDLEKLGRFKGSLQWAARAGKGGLRGNLDSVAGLAPLAGALGLPLEEWSLEGSAGVTVSLGLDKAGFTARARLDPAGLGLASPDGVFLASGCGGRLDLGLILAPSGRAKYQVSAGFDRGEMLYRSYYLNLAKSPFNLNGALSPSNSGWKTPGLALELKGLCRLALEGSLSQGGRGLKPDLVLSLDLPGLGAIRRDILKDALAESFPSLAAMRVEGSLSARLKAIAAKGGGVLVKGRLDLAEFSLGPEKGSPWVEGLALGLPVSQVFGQKPVRSPPAKADWGAVTVGRLKLPGLALDNLKIPLALVPNRLLTGPLPALTLYGAKVQLGRIEVSEPFSPEFKAATSLELKDLDLARLPLPVKLQGRLAGRLVPVLLDSGGIRSGGSLAGSLFGGGLSISHIHARPFSPGRGLGLDLKAENLDLLALTTALNAGVITGRADAGLTGFEMAYGQPVAFDLKVRSKRLGLTDQLVSLEAVNSISVMGTGTGLSGLGVAMFKQFFSKFPYQEIGFRCRLDNDVFRVQGLIKDDGVEYLIKKPPIMGINVINQNPDNLIGFSDMVQRLKRVMDDSGRKTGKAEAPKE